MTNDPNETKQPEQISDGCPSWAADDLVRLRLMEISLGNIPATAQWKSHHIADVQDRVFSESAAAYTDADIERHFDKTVRRLQSEKFEAVEIAKFINNRVGYEGGPQYCNIDEVMEVFTK